MQPAQELPQSNATCETLDVRGNLTVGGALTLDGLPVLPGGITTERVHVTTTAGTVTPGKNVSFVDYTGLSPEAPLGVQVLLAAGAVDGAQHVITLAAHANITWSVAPTTFLGGVAVGFPTGDPGAVTFVWDATAAGWRLASTAGGTVS